MDFAITLTDPVTNIVSIGIPRVPKILTGLAKLVQIVSLDFLRNPGRDVINPNSGAGFRAMIGQYNYSFGGKEVTGQVIRVVKQRQAAILAAQATAPGDPTEMLSTITVEDMAFDEGSSNLVVRVKITNQAGSSADVLL